MVRLGCIKNEDASGHMSHTACIGLVFLSLQEHTEGLKLHLSFFSGNRTSYIFNVFYNVLRYNKTASGKH